LPVAPDRRARLDATWGTAANLSGLSELEVAAGVVLGLTTGPPFPRIGASDPVAALRDQARTLLATPPCVIAFSGGRDSSALLAVFTDVARREGLPEPIAVTARWDDDPDSNESSWQEQVVRAVGVQQWEIVRPGTDLDLLGAEATGALDNMGLMWPPLAYAHLPLIRMASGGVFVTGEGGDEAFGLWPYWHLWSALRDGKAPRRADLRGLALRCAPRAVRRRRWMHTSPPYQTWLRPAAWQREAELSADEDAADPLRWDTYQALTRRRRSVALGVRTFEALCATEQARFCAPFFEEPFLASLARWGGRLGRGDRTAVMTALFEELLPGPVLSRTSKATFAGVFWGPESRRFAEEWQGEGFETDLVDPVALRRAWLETTPVYGSALPIHAAWLYRHGERR
jgi:asparagine synthetase B (glutamine-hydrolysing)